MDEFIKAQLEQIAQASQSINYRVTAILGYCAGQESGVEQYYTPLHLSPVFGNGCQEIISSTKLIKEIKEMMIELKIKGSVRERSNGLIELRTQALGSIYGRSKEEIEQKLTRRLKEAKQCKKATTKIKAPLLSEFFITEYLPYKKNQNRSQASIDSYHVLFRYVKRAQFDKALNLYKSKEIEDFLYSVPQTRTRQMLQGFLNNMFKRAVALGLIKINPCAVIEKVHHSQEQGTAFSFAEQKEFFNILTHTDRLTYREKCYYLFVYLTGTRKSEAIGVTVDDVDFDNKVLAIHGTKTDGSDRKVPLTPLVEKLLLSLHIKGNYFSVKEYSADKIFRKIWDKTKGHKLHDLRHTYGTIQICVEKMDIKTISLIMGHSTVNTTLAVYTHPEQLDKGTFLRGDLMADEKLNIYKSNYAEIICTIRQFLEEHTQ